MEVYTKVLGKFMNAAGGSIVRTFGNIARNKYQETKKRGVIIVNFQSLDELNKVLGNPNLLDKQAYDYKEAKDLEQPQHAQTVKGIEEYDPDTEAIVLVSVKTKGEPKVPAELMMGNKFLIDHEHGPDCFHGHGSQENGGSTREAFFKMAAELAKKYPENVRLYTSK